MNLRKLARLASTTAAALLLASAAGAQATRTWVSGVGDDANPCSRTAPCKTFAGAISKTAANGEISVLDPGGFGGVTITKAITINGYGQISGILNAGSNGIIVNAGVNDIVRIRDISIHGAGTGLAAIRFLAGKELHVERCEIDAQSTFGIEMSLSSAGGALFVADTNIRGVSGTATGVKITSSSGAAKTAFATLRNVKVEGVATGVLAADRSVVTLQGCSIVNASSDGVLASPTTSGNGADVTIDHSTLSFCGNAVRTATGGLVRVSESLLTANTMAFNLGAAGSIVSYGNNRVDGNGGGETVGTLATR